MKYDTDNREIILPNNEKIQIKEKGILNTTTELGTRAREASVVPGLRSASLISVGALCDDNCNVNFDKNKVLVMKNEKVIMKGERNRYDGLWDLPIERITTREKMNVIIQLDKNKMDLANFMHGAFYSPSINTLSRAIRNKQLLTFPGVEQINFNKYIKDTVATHMGHIKAIFTINEEI